jgi:F-type H+-transporting ATPase subunit delta
MVASTVSLAALGLEGHDDGSRDHNDEAFRRHPGVPARTRGVRARSRAVRRREPTAGRRLARALLETAGSDPEAGQAIRTALARACALLAEHPLARTFLVHPGVAPEDKERLLPILVGDEPAASPVLRLVRALGARGRLDVLADVEQAFVSQWNAQRGVVAAEVVSSVPLAAAQAAAVEAALARATRMSVQLSAGVDAEVIGGLIVRLNGRTLDGSVRGRLRALRERLRQAATAR